MSVPAPSFNFQSFIEQFPRLAWLGQGQLQFAWNMGANWVNQVSVAQHWGLGAGVAGRWQQAADLMGAVIASQLYGSGQEAPLAGPISGATEGSVSAQVQVPEFGSSAFRAFLLAAPPYGTMLLALLQVAAGVGPYIGSGRPAYVPP